MAVAAITINPVLVSNALGSFSTQTTGGVQGTIHDDPVTRFALRSGVLSPAAAQPYWGGCAMTVSLPTAGTEADEIESVLTISTAVANLNALTVFNQATAMIQSPQSTAPQAGPGMAMNFFLVGSGARIWVKAGSGVVAALAGGSILPTIYWDYTNQQLLTAGTGALGWKVLDVNLGNSKVITYASGTGFTTWGYGDAVLVEI